MEDQKEPIVEDALPQIFMSREKIVYTFPGDAPFEIPIREVLSTGSEAARFTNGLLWFLNVQLHSLVSLFQQAAAAQSNPKAAVEAAFAQMEAIPGFKELMKKVPGSMQTEIARRLRRKVD